LVTCVLGGLPDYRFCAEGVSRICKAERQFCQWLFHISQLSLYRVQDILSTLRQGLYEEREYLKQTRRLHSTSKSKHASTTTAALYSSGGPTRVINDAVKDLIREFKSYEEPFLITEHSGREKELEWSFDATQRHYRCDLPHRLMWLRVKRRVIDIAVRLQRVQTRKIAVEVTEARFMMGDMMGMVRDCEDKLRGIEERLQISRIG
jgi:hypothetical protein